MKPGVIILSVVTVMSGTADCYGQLFGERTLGRSLSRRARPSVPSMEGAESRLIGGLFADRGVAPTLSAAVIRDRL